MTTRSELAFAALVGTFSALAFAGCALELDPVVTASLPTDADRVWVGPEFYANRLMDWQLSEGRIEYLEGRAAKPMRTLHLLTRALSDAPGAMNLAVRTGPLEAEGPSHQYTWTGFLVGAGGTHVDFRISSLVHHWPAEDGGLIFAIDGTGRLVARDNAHNTSAKGPRADFTEGDWPLLEATESEGSLPPYSDVTLTLTAEPQGDDGYHVTLTAIADGIPAAWARYERLKSEHFSGNVALVSHNSARQEGGGYWFRDWSIEGTKVEHHPDRAFGPIMSTMYTVSDHVLKMTAQLGPIGDQDSREARLEMATGAAPRQWEQVASGIIDPASFTATLRVDDFVLEEDRLYRVAYDLRGAQGRSVTHYYEGTIRYPKVEDDEFVLASLNCQNISQGRDLVWNHSTIWYPHSELTSAVATHDPDMLFFAGDQIYESGLAGIVREPLKKALLDYQYHWYRFIWAFGDLMRDRPTVTIPDDHDVYHGNIWGDGGKKAEGSARPLSDNGGYIMDARFVNAVHRTQLAHLPDPYDPTPIDQDISVYYTNLDLGGMSFAIVADRMWKSTPREAVPEAEVRNGWPKNRDYDATTVTDATLLGARQLAFLDEWAQDFEDDTWMKVMLSQTLFSNLATLPEGSFDDSVVPQMRYAEPGEYISTDHMGTDMDSNGWPQAGRNRALRTIRKGFAFHVAGDQHLGSFVQYGIDDFNDGANAFISPAIANIWPRRWFPPEPGANRAPGAPAYTGEYLDGFGNRMTVHAVANPVRSHMEPEALYDRVPGYGIIRFRRADRTITSEAWPRWVDPMAEDAAPYDGWPVVVTQEDNYARQAAGYLPRLEISGALDPVVQVRHAATQEVVYTLRINGTIYRPKVFDPAAEYDVMITGREGATALVEGMQVTEDQEAVVNVTFASEQ